MLTQNEKEIIIDMWLNRPCTFAEIVHVMNQFRDEPVSEEEIEDVIDKIY